jgi:hypothetical protein
MGVVLGACQKLATECKGRNIERLSKYSDACGFGIGP